MFSSLDVQLLPLEPRHHLKLPDKDNSNPRLYFRAVHQITGMDFKIIVDIIGWIGSFELVLAYLLVSYERLAASSRSYQWLNLTGSVLLMINTAYYGAFPSTFVNIIWTFIAVAALYRIIFQLKK